MAPFRRSENTSAESGAGPAGSDPGSDEYATGLERFAGLSLPERAATVLQRIAPVLEPVDRDTVHGRTSMTQLLKPFDPPVGYYKTLSDGERARSRLLLLTVDEAFQALVLARMLIRHEATSDTTTITYAHSPDGRAALERGDVADVVARRLPD